MMGQSLQKNVIFGTLKNSLFYSVKRFFYHLDFDFQTSNGPRDPFIKTKQTSFSVFFTLEVI